VVFENGEMTPLRPGRVLYGPARRQLPTSQFPISK
jgi:hypothetical protein